MNTYEDAEAIEIKTLEELRCIRCCLERLLTSLDPNGFVDYQMEKFGKNYKQKAVEEKE